MKTSKELAADLRESASALMAMDMEGVAKDMFEAASRLEAKGEISEATVRKVAIAFTIAEGCGANLSGERVLCDDPRLPDEIRHETCGCLNGARAALEAAREGEKP